MQDNLAESVPLFEFAKCLLHLGKWEGYRDGYFNGPATWEADEFAEHDSRRAGCAPFSFDAELLCIRVNGSGLLASGARNNCSGTKFQLWRCQYSS